MRTLVLVALAGCGFQHGTLAGSGDGKLPDVIDVGTCSDGLKNGNETGVDCGGRCAACIGCTTHTLPPSVNVDATQGAASFLTSPAWNCNAAGTTTIDSAAGTITSTSCALGTLDFTNDVSQIDTSGPPVMVVRLQGLTVSNDHSLKLQGDKPVVFLVAGDVLVDAGGVIDAGANGSTRGPGGSIAGACIGGFGLPGSSSGWGGGGGGFGTAGGQGCYQVINGGFAVGSATLEPLRGGCSGAQANALAAGQIGGAGGGAVEISASGTITIGNTGAANVVSSGGGAPAYPNVGGGGGGSGGGILLVASAMPVFGASGAARAHGGSGSSGCSSCTNNDAGRDGHATDNNQATDTSGVLGGGNGNDHGRGGGLAYKVGAGSVVTMPGSMTTAQNGGRGGGGGGGGRIVVATGSTTMSCD